MEDKYFVIIKADYGYSIDEVETEDEATAFIKHPSDYEWIKFIKGVELFPVFNTSLEEEKF